MATLQRPTRLNRGVHWHRVVLLGFVTIAIVRCNRGSSVQQTDFDARPGREILKTSSTLPWDGGRVVDSAAIWREWQARCAGLPCDGVRECTDSLAHVLDFVGSAAAAHACPAHFVKKLSSYGVAARPAVPTLIQVAKRGRLEMSALAVAALARTRSELAAPVFFELLQSKSERL